jgi:hypothetical protein
MHRSDERGIALILTLFMVLILSVLGSSLVFVSRTETLSSLNYKTMSQARYGAESGVHRAANHLLFSYAPPNTAAEMALYNITVSPVRLLANNRPVVLDATTAQANYPDLVQRDAFAASFNTPLTINSDVVVYDARATLLTMRQIADPFSPGQTITLQTWEITGTGNVGGAGSASVEVSAIVERQAVPLFAFAAFATYPGCDALRFGGGATTRSYDSSDYAGAGTPTLDTWGGNVGTNGGLTEIGATTSINGTLSTPRTGVGNCSSGNVTALTTSGGATVTEGLVQLPQSVTYPTPPAPNPMPPVGNVTFNGSCPAATVAYCTGSGSSVTLDPALSGGTIVLGDVRVAAKTDMTLKPGVYIVNSLSFGGNASITVDVDTTVVPAQQVIFQVAGQGSNNTPIDFTGGSIVNSTYDPSRFQMFYAGTDNVKLTGGASSAALIYAPNASTSFSGGGQFYGAVVAGKVTDMGGAQINYDRNLETDTLTSGNWTMSSFTWSNF